MTSSCPTAAPAHWSTAVSPLITRRSIREKPFQRALGISGTETGIGREMPRLGPRVLYAQGQQQGQGAPLHGKRAARHAQMQVRREEEGIDGYREVHVTGMLARQ